MHHREDDTALSGGLPRPAKTQHAAPHHTTPIKPGEVEAAARAEQEAEVEYLKAVARELPDDAARAAFAALARKGGIADAQGALGFLREADAQKRAFVLDFDGDVESCVDEHLSSSTGVGRQLHIGLRTNPTL